MLHKAQAQIFFWLLLYDRSNTRNLLHRKSMYLKSYNSVRTTLKNLPCISTGTAHSPALVGITSCHTSLEASHAMMRSSYHWPCYLETLHWTFSLWAVAVYGPSEMTRSLGMLFLTSRVGSTISRTVSQLLWFEPSQPLLRRSRIGLNKTYSLS